MKELTGYFYIVKDFSNGDPFVITHRYNDYLHLIDVTDNKSDEELRYGIINEFEKENPEGMICRNFRELDIFLSSTKVLKTENTKNGNSEKRNS